VAFRNSASFGKRQEFVAIAELLRRGLDVYLTLVDDQQIDCVVRKEVSGEPVYLDIQIKARSKECYSEQADCYWVLPSLELIKEANRNKTGQNAGKYRIVFTNLSRKTGQVVPRPRFEMYRNNFELLKNYGEASP